MQKPSSFASEVARTLGGVCFAQNSPINRLASLPLGLSRLTPPRGPKPPNPGPHARATLPSPGAAAPACSGQLHPGGSPYPRVTPGQQNPVPAGTGMRPSLMPAPSHFLHGRPAGSLAAITISSFGKRARSAPTIPLLDRSICRWVEAGVGGWSHWFWLSVERWR